MNSEETVASFRYFSGFISTDLEKKKAKLQPTAHNTLPIHSLEKVKAKLGQSEKSFSTRKVFRTILQSFGIKFCFVSIDVDLAQPTAEGVTLFYERLVPGGVIIVHDYNPKWPALIEVVDDFVLQISEKSKLLSPIRIQAL